MKKYQTALAAVSVACVLHAAEFHVSPSGVDTNAGSHAAPFKTISKAAEVAQPGDVITVHEGVYRERISPPRGGTSDEARIVYRAAPGEPVTIKGSERITGWQEVEKDTWKVTLPNSFFGEFNPYSDLLHGDWYEAKRPYHTGAVYLNGHWLKEASRRSDVLKSEATGESEDTRAELMNIRQLIPGGNWHKAVSAKAYSTASEELNVIDLPDGQACVGRMRDGAKVAYEMDFGEESRHMAIYAASPIEGGWVEIRKGDVEGDLLGKFDVGFTAEWTTFQPYHANLKEALSGKQTIVLVFKSRPRRIPPAGQATSQWFAEVGAENTTIWAEFKDADPNQELVEINVRQSVIYPDKTGINYITVQGFTLEQAAPSWSPPTAEQIGLIGTHWSKGWVIADNTIRYSSCSGVTLGKGRDELDNTHQFHGTIQLTVKSGWNADIVGSHLVRNNHIYNCGQAGIVGSLGAIYSIIEGNEIHDIKKHHEYGGCETAGIKLHGAIDVVIRDNHVYNCEHWGGIWLDWMAQGARLTGNLLHDNSQDLMFEMNHGPFLVDNNLLLSRRQVTKVSSSGAYVHNLWYDNIGMWPTEARQTPFFKPHSTEIAANSPVNQNDDRFYNNLFVGAKGTAALDELGFACTAAGNVFLAGAKASKHDQHAIVPEGFDPAIKLQKKADGWWLEMNVDPAWRSAVKRQIVTTELLGKSAVTDASYEQPDGTPYRLDTDYFGNPRSATDLAAGSFALSGETHIRLKVWPKNVH